MKIENGKKVKIDYSISVEGVGVIESSDARGPLDFVQGDNALPHGLESQLLGMAVGDEKRGEFEVDIPTMTMARDEFPEGSKLEPGARFAAKRGGQDLEFTVEKVADDGVTVRPVHPLAGKKISYWFKVLEVGAPS